MTNVCANCEETTESCIGGKRLRRFSIFRKITTELSAADVITNLIQSGPYTPATKRKGKFLCLTCFQLLEQVAKFNEAKEKFMLRTTEHAYIQRKRKRSPSASAADNGHISKVSKTRSPFRVSSLKKKSPAPQRARTFSQRVANCISNHKYSAALRLMIGSESTPTAKKALTDIVSQTVWQEFQNMSKRTGSALEYELTMENLERFDWRDVFAFLKRRAPIFFASLTGAISKVKKKTQCDIFGLAQPGDTLLSPALGFIFGTVLHVRAPRKFTFLQAMNSIQMWKSGCSNKLYEVFNHLGICLSSSVTLKILDEIRVTYDKELSGWKQELENLYFGGGRASSDEESSNSPPTSELPLVCISDSDSADSVWKSESDFSVSPADKSDEHIVQSVSPTPGTSSSQADCVGFTLCWDNVGKHVTVRHQSTRLQNRIMLWALAYATRNRIPYQMPGFEVPVIKASEINVKLFLPQEDDNERLESRLIVIVKRILKEHLGCMKDSSVQEHIGHSYSTLSSKRSDLVNLGVLKENPSSTSGVIRILDHLQRYVPKSDAKMVPLICWGDGLSCERHNDAQNVRINGKTMEARLEGLEPAPQEFHKRMLIMQDTMDQLFHGHSSSDKGTLFHLKNVFNHRSVKKNVSECFNHCSEFLRFVTEGMVTLAAMQLLKITDVNEKPQQPKDSEDMAREIVKMCWLDRNIPDVFKEQTLHTAEDYPFCFCKTDIGDEEDMLRCENVNCEKGKLFHVDCLGFRDDEIPIGEWYCSEECRIKEHAPTYPYCDCKTNLGYEEPMIGCSNTNCTKGEWFHYACRGLTEKDIPSGSWFCSDECAKIFKRGKGKKGKKTAKVKTFDHVMEYCKATMWRGLNDLVRRDAVRENDGPAMISFWKHDMLEFHNNNHFKYIILGHKMIAGCSGWLDDRLRHDLIWNRTVNLTGGMGHNIEMDLVNEFLNGEFKNALRKTGHYEESTVRRISELSGSFGERLKNAYASSVSEVKLKKSYTRHPKYHDDVMLFVKLFEKEKFFCCKPGRKYRAFPDFIHDSQIKNPQKLGKKIVALSKKLDQKRKLIAN